MKKVIINAIGYESGMHFNFENICLNVADDMCASEVKRAIAKASVEYCQTEEGRDVFEHNCRNFNYGDFNLYVPNEICGKYGIEKIDSEIEFDDVNFNEQLVDETELEGDYENELG